ncbi:MAG: nucleotide 5'-monophosphate nucleosidase PpnN [Burkholderiaceae bacterium]
MKYPVMDGLVAPEGHLEVLSRREIAKLLDNSQTGLHQLFRSCALAVLASADYMDDGKALMAAYPDFDIRIVHRERGIKLELSNAPASAFVDGRMILGMREHLFATLRDILFTSAELALQDHRGEHDGVALTDLVFHILRNANVLQTDLAPNLVVCWGGHSISRTEYEYTKRVGYQMGLRGLDICTGCGPGAMKGPMKGAAIGHAKQRIANGRYLGFTEPGIIAAESPNAIVNNLVILPDIEKRLEAFVRAGHVIVVFPGGVGTAEEILYLLGILLHPENQALPFPLVFTGPAESAAYFHQIDEFIGATLGAHAQSLYRVVIDDPEQVARLCREGTQAVREHRKQQSDAYYFNWQLKIDGEFQRPFVPTHASMRALNLRRQQQPHLLAADLRRAFSGVVAGNVKLQGIQEIERHGLFDLHGDTEIMAQMDRLLSAFVEQSRMKLPGSHYQPCYRIRLTPGVITGAN